MNRQLGLIPLFLLVAPQLFGISTQDLFQRLTGRPILKTDPNYSKMEALLSASKPLEAARIATDDADFYENTVRYVAAVMSNRDESPLSPLNDLTALFVGIVRDELDARLFLTGDFRYEGKPVHKLPLISFKDNQHFNQFEARNLSLMNDITQIDEQWSGYKGSGAFTTRAWAEAHYFAGTNRRSGEFAFREFLCSPIEAWKTPGLSAFHIRRDVDRKPGGDSNRFETECRSCHAALDAMTGAFSNLDFRQNRLIIGSNWVAPKYNHNGDVYPPGYLTQDSTWVMLLSSPAHVDKFGWRGNLEGTGVDDFASLIANSKGFSNCMVKRVFEKVCRRGLRQDEQFFLVDQTEKFESDYNLKRLFERVAVADECLKE